MHAHIRFSVALILLAGTGLASAQDVAWRSATPPSNPGIKLGRATPIAGVTPSFTPVRAETPRVVRGQIPDPPSFPSGGGGPPPTFGPTPNSIDIYNRGGVNSNNDLGNYWDRFCNKFKRCWDDVIGSAGGAFQPGPDRSIFQSDRKFDIFTSPVSNPFYFEDPRALTEIRPVFIWQHTPSTNTVWNGGDNFAFAARGSVAFTPNISLVVNRVGWSFISPKTGTPDIGNANGFSELHLGPKFTIIRNDVSNTVAAVGLTFEIPTGSSRVLQDTGSLSFSPYFSLAQNFLRSEYGSFNFMTTSGYVFRTDGQRTESIFASFHIDYDIRNSHRVYPLAELNFRHYTRNGNARDLDFEGSDLGNFGSRSVSGLSELSLALGARFVINNNVHFGIAAEFNVLPNSSGRHLDQFRLTTDFIFRY